MKRILWTAPIILLLAAVAVADDYTITRKPKVGDTMKMQMKADLTISGAAAAITAVVVQKVTKADPDGTYTVEETQISGTIKLRDLEMKAPQTPPSTTKYKPTGEVVEFINEQGKHDLRVANLTVFKLPTKPMKIGDTWNWEYKGDKTLETVNVKAVYTILGEETIGKRKCVKIKELVSETEGNDAASVESTVWYDITDWTEVRVASKWTNVPMSGGSPVNGNVKLERVDD